MSVVVDIAERAASTFLFTFLGAAPTVIVAFDTSALHTVEVAATAAGLATVQSLIKNTLAYFTARGNGPDVVGVVEPPKAAMAVADVPVVDAP